MLEGEKEGRGRERAAILCIHQPQVLHTIGSAGVEGIEVHLLKGGTSNDVSTFFTATTVHPMGHLFL